MSKREEEIVRVLLNHPDKWLTRRDIARLMGLKKTPYLNNVLDNLVERGVVKRELGSWGGFSCWFFSTDAATVQPFISIPLGDFFVEGKGNGWQEQ